MSNLKMPALRHICKASLLIYFLFLSALSFGGDRSLDSMLVKLKEAKADTLKLTLLNALVEEISDESVWPKYNEQLGALAHQLKKSSNPAVVKAAKRHYATYLNNLGYLWLNKGNSTIALAYFKESLIADREIGNLHGQAYSENNIGIMYMNEGKIDTALSYFYRSLDKYKQIKDKKGEALSLNNLGFIFNRQGNIPRALEYFDRSLKIREETGNKQEQGYNHVNIGSIYSDQKDFVKAIESFDKAYKIFEEISSRQGMASALNNIGTCYKDQENYVKAIRIFRKCSKLFSEIGDKHGLAASEGNIGICSFHEGNNDTAIYYLNKSLNLYIDLKDKEGLSHTYNNLAMVYLKTGKVTEAKQAAQQSFKLSEELNFPEEISQAAHTLSAIFRKQGDCENSYKMFELFISMRDTTRNSTNEKAIVKQQAKYEYERKTALAAAEQEKIAAIAAAETRRQKIILWFTFFGLLMVITFSIFLYRRFKITQKQKIIIEKQKAEVDKQREIAESQRIIAEEQREISENQRHLIQEINNEIVDSINYAKRLQDATLPAIDFIKEFIPELFILYKPKDIVAGDFYWFEKKKDYVYIAAADCTGHGVPGAMVSVVCSNALYRAVNEFGLIETGEILDKVRELVVETFEKSDNSVKDGMDVSLIRFNLSNPAYGTSIQWSGANNPLWIVEGNREKPIANSKQPTNDNGINLHEKPYSLLANDSSLKQIKADKQPIGKCDNPLPFTSHNLLLEKNSHLYIFTDGYADQFGGPNGKKFMYKPLQNLLLGIAGRDMDKQKEALNISITEWMKNTSQVDDICIIGIKV